MQHKKGLVIAYSGFLDGNVTLLVEYRKKQHEYTHSQYFSHDPNWISTLGSVHILLVNS